MNKFKDRLKIAIKNESARSFAGRAGLSEGMITKYLLGPTLPGLENLIAITKAAEVNIKWLATGEGPMSGRDPIDV
jgi:transcriptional regulator with XRE-family HTH domain